MVIGILDFASRILCLFCVSWVVGVEFVNSICCQFCCSFDGVNRRSIMLCSFLLLPMKVGCPLARLLFMFVSCCVCRKVSSVFPCRLFSLSPKLLALLLKSPRSIVCLAWLFSRCCVILL